jgi:hypothetical protein
MMTARSTSLIKLSPSKNVPAGRLAARTAATRAVSHPG